MGRMLRPYRKLHSTGPAASQMLDDSIEQMRAEIREELREELREEMLRDEAWRDADMSVFVGAQSNYTTSLKFWVSDEWAPPLMPCFRILDDTGAVVPGAEAVLPQIDDAKAVAMHETMVRVSEFDKVYLEAQRQGRIAFYLTSRGEEACSVASVAPLDDTDWLLPQYRELGAAFWRGFSFREVANQLCANSLDPARGRQLPLHIGSRRRHFLYVKSTLATQGPHAAGVAFAMKLAKRDQVAVCYFGDGSASEGDIPSALNISAVHGCPAIFFCRNNGYAISTGTKDQYRGDGIAPRGLAFGIPSIRVDGNDALAVYAATQEARRIAIEQRTPILIEAMTYRIGAHSTSDDDSKYRTQESPIEGWDSERAYWESRSPIIRFGRYLQSKGLFSAQREEQLRKMARREAINVLNEAEQEGKPNWEYLFTDVYDTMPWMLKQQRDNLAMHMERHAPHYDAMKGRPMA